VAPFVTAFMEVSYRLQVLQTLLTCGQDNEVSSSFLLMHTSESLCFWAGYICHHRQVSIHFNG